MKRPDFTPEQLEYLARILSLGCCHVSGEHSPTHFVEQRYICVRQKSEAWERAVVALGWGRMVDRPHTSPDIVDLDPRLGPFPGEDCGWCESHGIEGRHAPNDRINPNYRT